MTTTTSSSATATLPEFQHVRLARSGRLLTLTLDRPELLNAFGQVMHKEIGHALAFAGRDPDSDVVLLTGAGRAFSAGGDIAWMARVIDEPELFEAEVAGAKRLVFELLDIDKPVIAKLNGHAVGLGATLALLCDVIFAAEHAKIGDPHVAVGLVAGDGGTVIWPQLVGFARAKEYLLTGDLMDARRAAEIGLINHAVPAAELDARVQAFCDRLLQGATKAIRWTKTAVNLELKRIAHATLDASLHMEALSVRSADHREAIRAFQEKRAPRFGQG